jgi:GNAT superfamily N-acetyltransferase
VPSVRAATHADLEAVVPLWRELEAVQGPTRLYPMVAEAEARIRASFTGAIVADEADLLVAYEDGETIGMALVRLEHPSRMSDELAAELSRVVVRSDRRGSGAGRALIEAAEAWARERGVRTLVASIFIANQDSMRFWRAVGFEPWVERLVRPIGGS